MSDAEALALLDQLLPLTGAERAQRLEQLAAENSALHRRLQRLLAFAEADDSSRVLSQPVLSELQATQHDSLLMLEPGAIVSGYRLLRELGRGGTSVVWLAERADGVVKREVAVKIPSVTFVGESERQRFVREKDVLAALTHTHIARLYDAGFISNKHPFLALEYVDGEPLTGYCDRERLNIERRLKLFLQVLEAVAYAHSRLVVHRDLKPSNILVDRQGQVKLVDFGIAKALEETNRERTQLTLHGQVIGTPQYMSPEQADLDSTDIDVRSDVYSLGAVLYELLCGALPLDIRVRDGHLDNQLQLRDPPTPSRRVSQSPHDGDFADHRATDVATLRKSLQGDLDWIVMKAIAKDRNRRYQTADAFATDINRYLDHLPVLARPPTVGYLMSRFVRRNKLLTGSAAVALLSLVAGALMATVGMMRALEAERRAVAEAETSSQVSGLLVGLFEVSDPGEARGRTITAREVLDQGAQRIQNQLQDQPRVRAELMSTIGRVYTQLGLYHDALPLAEQALQLRRQLSPQSIEIADSLDEVGHLLTLLSKPADATPLHIEALQIRRLLEAEPGIAQARSLEHIGVSWMQRDGFDEALKFLMEARRLQEVVGPVPPMQRATLASYIGQIHHYRDDMAAAEPFYAESVDVLRTQVGADHPALAAALTNLAILFKDTNRRAAAIAANDEALAIYLKAVGERHPQVAQLQNNIALLFLAEGDLEAALVRSNEAVRLNRELLGPEHEETNITRVNRARILARHKDYAAAERELREVLDLRRRVLQPGHFEIGLTLDALTSVLNMEADYVAAIAAAREAVDIMRTQMGPDHSRTASAEVGLGIALAGTKHYHEAEPLLLHAYKITTEGRGRAVGTARAAAEKLIVIYDGTNRPIEAQKFRATLVELN